MTSYIRGYYSPSALELNVFEKETNRKIIDSIREAYPTGITALELADMTGLPIKTVYAQLRELCRENLVTELPKQQTGRGRPKTTGDDPAGTRQQQRQRSRYIIEDTTGIYHSHIEDVEKKMILPPGHVLYSNDFLYLWDKTVAKEDEDELSIVLLRFLDRITRMVEEVHDDRVKKIAPPKTQYCCSLCGVNHQARDFLRAILLHLIDQLEENDKFVKFLHDSQFLTQESYEDISKRLEAKHNELLQVEKKKRCDHLRAENASSFSSTISVCEDCEKEGKSEWIGLRLCMVCGHVGCDDSSKGMHATKHFVNTGHPVIVALPDKAWKWCYIDKLYG
jgi:hypothetical protein